MTMRIVRKLRADVKIQIQSKAVDGTKHYIDGV